MNSLETLLSRSVSSSPFVLGGKGALLGYFPIVSFTSLHLFHS